MNIKCNYCGEMFSETLEKCPSCGAPNSNVKRTTVDQPTTIEELKDWYRSKGLPSYETTRFFIGIDYKGPRAFGIYYDKYLGYVVYKNKGNGERAIRYQGTDEAYAVNELFMRLKQEILEQKSRNLDIRSSPYITPKEKKALEEEKEEAYKTFIRENTKEEAAREAYLRFKGEAEYEHRRNKTIVAGIIVAVVICLIFGYATFRAYVKKQIVNAGYYKYNNEVYYHGSTDEYSHWFKYDTADNDWYSENVYDLPLVDKLHSRKYFVSEEDYSALGCSDVKDSVDYKIFVYGTAISPGYYKYGDHYYYHAENHNSSGWFKFNNVKMDWDYSTFSTLPEALQHQYSAVEYSYDFNFNGERYHPFTDVKQSQAYKITYPEEFASYPKESKDEGYYSKDGKIYYHNDSYASENWYEYNSTTKQWNQSYQVPDDVESYSPNYFGIKDFTETEYYSDAHPWEKNSDSSGNNYSYSSNSNSGSKTSSDSWWSSSSDSSWDNDSSWSWSSSDSWDSGSTDWSSDW